MSATPDDPSQTGSAGVNVPGGNDDASLGVAWNAADRAFADGGGAAAAGSAPLTTNAAMIDAAATARSLCKDIRTPVMKSENVAARITHRDLTGWLLSESDQLDNRAVAKRQPS